MVFRVSNQGGSPMSPVMDALIFQPMASFILRHRHEPEECPSAYAAWKGFESPLRGQEASSSCRLGGHEIWWQVEAADEEDALSRLPGFLAKKTEVTRVHRVEIP